MKWKVYFTNKATKQAKKLPRVILASLQLLVCELEQHGSNGLKDWPNYGKLKGMRKHECWHCHLKKGKPTYVCCWEVVDKQIKLIEVYYVGTHEKAPY